MNVVQIPENFNWNEVGEILCRRVNDWPLQIDEWHQIELTRSIAISLFMRHNIEPTTHQTTFNDLKDFQLPLDEETED